MLHIEDREIERRLEALGARTPQAKVGLARQMLLHASERMVSARDRLAAELRQAESEPLLELTDELWEEILTGPPRPGRPGPASWVGGASRSVSNDPERVSRRFRGQALNG